MQSPYRRPAEPEKEEPRSTSLGVAVPACLALGIIVELVGAATHSLDSFGHFMVGFAFVVATAGLQAGRERRPP